MKLANSSMHSSHCGLRDLAVRGLIVFGLFVPAVAPICQAQISLARIDTTASTPSCSVSVHELRCEYLREPLGIDVRFPRLSWKLMSTNSENRGQRQSAYEVLVSSSREILDRDEGDLWKSGTVASNKSVLIEYEGSRLKSGDECFWKVRIWDEAGIASEWSSVSRWTVGPINKSDWLARWIGAAEEKPPDQKPSSDKADNDWDPWFRKTFTLESPVKRAEVHLASVGYHELYVNGRKASDDVLAPAVSNHRVRARYVTYDIAQLLRPGSNVIAVWLGTSWSIFPEYQTPDKPSRPIFTAQATIECTDGMTIDVFSDSNWKTHASPNKLIGKWRFASFGGEFYDANKDVPNWNAHDYDDSSWQQATEYSPDLILSAQVIEPNRIISEIKPVSIKETSPDTYRVDMGVNFAGWIEVDVIGGPGDHIEIQSSELPHHENTFGIRSTYVVGPQGFGTFRNRFNYHSGQWLTIKGVSRRPFLTDIRGYQVRTDYERIARFECSNDLINRIYETTLWTFENLSLGGYVVDCPQRERMGYGGDAHATLAAALNSYALGAFYSKWNQDWHDVQFDDGFVPHTAPTYWGGGGPSWGGFCVTLPWEMYCRYGDRRILEQSLPTIEKWLGYVESQSHENMLLPWQSRFSNDNSWAFLGDWLWPGAKGTNSHTEDSLFFNNCYWIYNLETAANIADTLGKQELGGSYRARSEQIRQAVHHKFYQPESHSYVSGEQAYLAVALLAQLPPPSERELVWKQLENEILERRTGHIHAGITGGAFLFKLLMDEDRHDLIHVMVNRDDYPGWGDMLRQGATTIWESWDVREGSGGSKLHSSYLYVGAWPIQGLAGIRPISTAGGFQEFRIEPVRLESHSLKWMSASYESEYGTIACHSGILNEKNFLRVTVPANTHATVSIPARMTDQIVEGMEQLRGAPGVVIIGEQNGRVSVNLEPGRYHFTWQNSGKTL